MKSLVNSIWTIPVVSVIGYLCVYIYNLAYLRFFDIPINIANIILEDFFGLGLFVAGIFIVVFIILRAKMTEKTSFGLLNVIKNADATLWLVLSSVVIFAVFYFLTHTNLYLAISYTLLLEFFCFVYRIFSKDVLDITVCTEAIIAFLLSICMSGAFGFALASQQTGFIGEKVPDTTNKYYLLIKRNAGSEGVFKIYDKDTGEWDNGFNILNIDNRYYTTQTITKKILK